MPYPYYVHGEYGGKPKKVPCSSAEDAQMHYESMLRNGWRKVTVWPDMMDAISKAELERLAVDEKRAIRNRIEAEHTAKADTSTDGDEAV